MVKIRWSSLARDDLREIVKYIAQDSPDYAKFFAQKIITYVKNLKSFPRVGRSLKEVANPDIRQLIYQNYRIIYQIQNDVVEIITIVHCARLLRF